jgi:hypothetical protein
MIHLGEEELIAQAYGEGDKAAAKEHLDQCAECCRAYAELRSDMAEMNFIEPPEPDAFYGEKVWASLSGSLPAYEPRKRNWLHVGPWRGLSYAAACVLVGACTFIGGRIWERKQVRSIAETDRQQKQQQVVQVPARERVVVVVLGDHLDRSERLLVELKHSDAESTGIASPLREEAQSLLAANRICRENAKHDDDAALATALDRLDHLLQELVNQPGGLNAATLARLQNEINADGLLLEVRVLRSRLPNQPTAASGQSKGSTI